jgi:hypothetical protein
MEVGSAHTQLVLRLLRVVTGYARYRYIFKFRFIELFQILVCAQNPFPRGEGGPA